MSKGRNGAGDAHPAHQDDAAPQETLPDRAFDRRPHHFIDRDGGPMPRERIPLERDVAARARGCDAVLHDREHRKRGESGGDEDRARAKNHRFRLYGRAGLSRSSKAEVRS